MVSQEGMALCGRLPLLQPHTAGGPASSRRWWMQSTRAPARLKELTDHFAAWQLASCPALLATMQEVGLACLTCYTSLTCSQSRRSGCIAAPHKGPCAVLLGDPSGTPPGLALFLAAEDLPIAAGVDSRVSSHGFTNWRAAHSSKLPA